MPDERIDPSRYLQKPIPPQKMSGGRFIAETFKGYGVTHVFFVEAIARLALVEMEDLGIERVLAHSEKAAAYMADGYARVSRRPGICMAQSVGAANLASRIVMTGRSNIKHMKENSRWNTASLVAPASRSRFSASGRMTSADAPISSGQKQS